MYSFFKRDSGLSLSPHLSRPHIYFLSNVFLFLPFILCSVCRMCTKCFVSELTTVDLLLPSWVVTVGRRSCSLLNTGGTALLLMDSSVTRLIYRTTGRLHICALKGFVTVHTISLYVDPVKIGNYLLCHTAQSFSLSFSDCDIHWRYIPVSLFDNSLSLVITWPWFDL